MPISPPAPAATEDRARVLGEPCPERGLDAAAVARALLGGNVRGVHRAGRQQRPEA